jgi:endonuclease G
VRRLDPCWGEDDVARQANTDSMFFPNIAPQHKNLNQKIWNDLEDHILETVDDRNARISVFVGCIFRRRRSGAAQ